MEENKLQRQHDKSLPESHNNLQPKSFGKIYARLGFWRYWSLIADWGKNGGLRHWTINYKGYMFQCGIENRCERELGRTHALPSHNLEQAIIVWRQDIWASSSNSQSHYLSVQLWKWFKGCQRWAEKFQLRWFSPWIQQSNSWGDGRDTLWVIFVVTVPLATVWVLLFYYNIYLTYSWTENTLCSHVALAFRKLELIWNFFSGAMAIKIGDCGHV